MSQGTWCLSLLCVQKWDTLFKSETAKVHSDISPNINFCGKIKENISKNNITYFNFHSSQMVNCFSKLEITKNVVFFIYKELALCLGVELTVHNLEDLRSIPMWDQKRFTISWIDEQDNLLSRLEQRPTTFEPWLIHPMPCRLTLNIL